MKRSGITLDEAVEQVFIGYGPMLTKKGIPSKSALKKKMLEYYSPYGDLESYVFKISLDKFITLMMRMAIDTPTPGTEVKETPASDNEKSLLRTEVIKYVRKYIRELAPLPGVGPQIQQDLEVWEEENSEDIKEMFDNVVDNFGERAVQLGLDVDHVAIQAYHAVIEDEF